MLRRFQFSLGRLMVAVSAACLGALLFADGLAESDYVGPHLLASIFANWLIGGAIIGLLVSEKAIAGALFGLCCAVALWGLLALFSAILISQL